MPIGLQNWPTQELKKAMRQHLDRMDSDPEYRARVESEGARRQKAYEKHKKLLDALVAAGKTWPP